MVMALVEAVVPVPVRPTLNVSVRRLARDRRSALDAVTRTVATCPGLTVTDLVNMVLPERLTTTLPVHVVASLAQPTMTVNRPLLSALRLVLTSVSACLVLGTVTVL